MYNSFIYVCFNCKNNSLLLKSCRLYLVACPCQFPFIWRCNKLFHIFQGLFFSQQIFTLVALMPPVVLAVFVHDVGQLVALTVSDNFSTCFQLTLESGLAYRFIDKNCAQFSGLFCWFSYHVCNSRTPCIVLKRQTG